MEPAVRLEDRLLDRLCLEQQLLSLGEVACILGSTGQENQRIRRLGVVESEMLLSKSDQTTRRPVTFVPFAETVLHDNQTLQDVEQVFNVVTAGAFED